MLARTWQKADVIREESDMNFLVCTTCHSGLDICLSILLCDHQYTEGKTKDAYHDYVSISIDD